ncbi:glycoside hydrolase family 73 protein [Clostridium sp. MSJ-8]|uniref:glycoside hydrolase family 73 protein n=1 Tax=Clostridium sp. MSJ-8 TaxID=2841510 RepID=UPI001C0EFE07|nr:glycoside hydrolase family 73 protein [Clostridium sp. MSJ-8]MBU5487615.1 glycoside hydrolase family 73 protein [Clostridium sp. MSJ-8]
MKKRYFLLIAIIVLLQLTFTSYQVNADDKNTSECQDFIESIVPEAIEGYKEYKILPSLTIAQAILESSWGKSALTIEANNLFGIKAYDDWTGTSIPKPTKEYIKGSFVVICANFKVYQSRDESIKDHNYLLSSDRYKLVREASNYVDACYAIYNCGYASSPNYSNSLIKIIDNYKLYNYDTLAKDIVTKEERIQKTLNDPIILTANNKNYTLLLEDEPTEKELCVNTNSIKDSKEDTNNIPLLVSNNAITNYNYWYVIYCLLPAYYSDTIL